MQDHLRLFPLPAALLLLPLPGPSAQLTPSPWSTTGAAPGAALGASTAGAGDVNGDGFDDLLIGIPSLGGADEGAVQLYLGKPLGPSSTPDWTASGAAAGQRLGAAVSPAGDVDGDGYSDVLVGAPGTSNGQANEGCVLLFRGTPLGLEASPAWSFESDVPDLELGDALACAGDVNGDGYSDVLVGLPRATSGAGAARLFLGSPSGLTLTPSWSVTGTAAGTALGTAVASAGDVNGDGFADVLVGAPGFTNAESGEGAVLVHLGSASGLALAPVATLEGDLAGAALGSAVASAGDVDADGFDDLLAGAPGYANGQVGEGAVLLYRGAPSGPLTTPAWLVEGNATNRALGATVCGAGDLDADGHADVVLGLPNLSNGETEEGAVQVHRGSPAGLSTTPDLLLESDDALARRGASLAPAGDVDGDGFGDLVVGAPGHDAGAGLASLLFGAGLTLADDGDVVFDGLGVNSGLGSEQRSAGDVNGDGFDDLVAGAYQYDEVLLNDGHAWLWFGSGNGLVPTPGWELTGTQSHGWLGASVAGLGDVNGDGHADFAIGAPRETDGQTTEGTVHVFLGSSSGISAVADQRLELDQVGAQFGWSVDGGDFDGDGYADLVAGAFTYDDAFSDEGGVFLFRGSPTGLETTPGWSWTGGQAGANGGSSVASAGDVNGDGISDLLVGALRWDGGEVDEGRAGLFLGTPSGPETTPSWSFETDQADAWVHHLACAGDVNGDGFSDVLVGSHRYDNAGTDRGTAWVFLGSPAGLPTTPSWIDPGIVGSFYHAGSGGLAGDVNGDGVDDLVLGSLWYSEGQTREGAAFLHLGGAGAPSSVVDWSWQSNQSFAAQGVAGTAGDVDGDGFGDLLLGGSFDSTASDSGRILTFRGDGGGGGAVFAPQQLRSDGTPIVPLGRSDLPNAVRLRLRLEPDAIGLEWSGALPVRAFLEWEVKPIGVPFDGTGLGRGQVGAVLVPGGPALVLEEPVTGLAADTGYRWRARVATTDPLHSVTRWVSPGAERASNEVHFRTAPPSPRPVRPGPAIHGMRSATVQ